MNNRYILLCLFLLPLAVLAQVGVNTSQPKQALDVNGKVGIGDDAKSPTAGTLRYNQSQDDFEGFDGKDWKSFTESSSDGLPGTQPEYITARSSNLSPGNVITIYFETREDNDRISTPGSGQYFLVTSINVMPNFFTFTAHRYALSFSPSSSPNSGFGDLDNSFRMTGNLSQQNFITSQTPILVIGPGEYLRVEASSANEAVVNLDLRGYLVNGLKN